MIRRLLGGFAALIAATGPAEAGVLDVDFGLTSSVQPGFVNAFGQDFPSPSGVTFDLESLDGLPIASFVLPAANQGPLGALLSDGLLFPDDFVAMQQGVSFGAGYSVTGLDPNREYELTFLSPPIEGFNEVSARGVAEGVLMNSAAFPGYSGFIVQPTPAGEITGSVSSATGPSFWSGLSIRLVVPEASAVAALGVTLATLAVHGRRP